MSAFGNKRTFAAVQCNVRFWGQSGHSPQWPRHAFKTSLRICEAYCARAAQTSFGPPPPRPVGVVQATLVRACNPDCNPVFGKASPLVYLVVRVFVWSGGASGKRVTGKSAMNKRSER